jgi:putative hydrolase of the HAD superfamily
MSGSDRRVDAVTFDYWDTLVRASPPPFAQARLDALVAVLAAHDRIVAPAAVVALMAAVFTEEFTPAWQRNEQYTAVDAARSLVQRLDVAGRGRVEDDVVEAFVAAGDAAATTLTPGIAESIRTLVDAGVRVGIICDVGLTPSVTLRRALEHHGLLVHFTSWSFSDDVGVYKPDAAIFRDALDGLGGVAPGRTAHVGDLRRTDVAGARAMGMTAVRYTGVADDPTEGPEGHHVLTDHADLPGLLLS